MTFERGMLAKVDQKLRSELDHAEGVQLVKVPVSEAAWSTWRRYCDLMGVTMGKALSILLHSELASIADRDIEGLVAELERREMEIDERTSRLEACEKQLQRRERDVAKTASELQERQRSIGPTRAPLGASSISMRNDWARLLISAMHRAHATCLLPI